MRRGPTTDVARRLLDRRVIAVLRQRRAVLRRAHPDDIHDLRVATRRLQEAIDLMAFALPVREHSRARRRVRRIRRGLAEVRDADVLVETLRAMTALARPDEKPALAALGSGFVARARRAREDLRAAEESAQKAQGTATAGLAPVPGRPGAGPTPAPPGGIDGVMARGRGAPRAGLPVPGVRKRLRALRRTLPALPGAALRRAASERLALRSGAVGRDLARAGRGRAADLHRLRLAVKKYRYTLELMHEAGFGRHARAIAAARRLQEALGHLHDVDVLATLLRGGADRGRRALPAAIRAERRVLAARALALASRFRPAGGAVTP